METEEFVNEIRKKFSYLFDQYQFRLLYLEPMPSQGERLRVGVASPMCRLLFDQERGANMVLIGSPVAPFDQNDNQEGIDPWINLERMINYIEQRPFRWVPVHEISAHSDVLGYISAQLRPCCDAIFPLFQSQAEIEKWYPQFHDYAMQQVQLYWGNQ